VTFGPTRGRSETQINGIASELSAAPKYSRLVTTNITPGTFVQLRGLPWLVEDVCLETGGLETIRLSCIADDSQGEQLEIIWDAEIGATILGEDNWDRVGTNGPDSADVFAAHLRVIRWNSSTAAERDLLQAPFRAGIRLDTYQLLPLRKALRLRASIY